LPVNYNELVGDGMKVAYFRSDDHVADVSAMKDLGVSEGDFVYVLGFPMGLIGGTRNTVIVRGGNIARIQDTLAGTSWLYLVDATIFPGNSGGPVVVKPEAFAIEGTKAQSRAYLVGIVQGYVPYEDVAISQQTGRPRVVFEENSGLGAVHPVDV